MSNIQIFNYNDCEVRTVEINGEIWWVLKDVCNVLGVSKYRDVASRLDEDERGSVRVDTLGGEQDLIAINESGLYSVILRSDKPQAKPFRKWVTSVVLPTIRKTGSYSLNGSSVTPIEDPGKVASLINTLKSTMKAQYSTPFEIAAMVKMVCDQYGIRLPASFVKTELQIKLY